jgi:hypothetical protein
VPRRPAAVDRVHRDAAALRRADTDLPYAIAAVLREDTERWQERHRLRKELAEAVGTS